MNKTLFDGTHVDDYICHITSLIGAALTICNAADDNLNAIDQVQIILQVTYNDLTATFDTGAFDFLSSLRSL